MKKRLDQNLSSMREYGDTIDAVMDIYRYGIQCGTEERRHNTLPIPVVM